MANSDIDAKIGSVIAAPLFETIATEAICPKLSNRLATWQFPGSGLRDPARVLTISPTTGTRGIKKKLERQSQLEKFLFEVG